jgi:hypothetical protein
MTTETMERPPFIRRVTTFLSAFVHYLDYTAVDYNADQIGHAMGRIRELERDVADLKARLPT